MNDEDELAVYLSRRGEVPGIGPERGAWVRNGISRYVSPHGSYRYVFYSEGEPVAGLQVVSRDGRHAAIANVFTRREWQRRGLASKLLARARRDFESVVHAEEPHLSEAGRAWKAAVRDPAKRRIMTTRRRAPVRPQRFVLGGRGLEKPLSIRVLPGRIYYLGASSSPTMIYVTDVDEERIRYKTYPFTFTSKEAVIERWIGEDLIAKGSRTTLKTRGEYLSPDVRESLESTLAGGEGVPIDFTRYAPVSVEVVLATRPRPGEDPWYWAEEYGGVGSRQGSQGETVYVINTTKGNLEDLESDPRFRVLKIGQRDPSRRRRV